jgi:glutamate formiminotransferase
MTQLLQCVPNFSEGRRPEVVESIVTAIRETPGVRLADWSADPDHNRMVVTFVGPAGAVCAAARAACAVAIARIDLREHQGVHPRLGALDVLPLVPLAGTSLAECAAYAGELGRELAVLHSLPVFLYEAAAEDGRSLPFVRKAAFHSLRPDFGPAEAHPSAGAIVVGAREPLIAYNINLTTPDVRAAKKIAQELRENGGAGFIGVRALGLSLASRGLTQVSMNITRTEATPLLSVFAYVTRRAAESGTSVLESEVIGALPGYSAFAVVRDALRAAGLSPDQVLWENWRLPNASDSSGT